MKRRKKGYKEKARVKEELRGYIEELKRVYKIKVYNEYYKNYGNGKGSVDFHVQGYADYEFSIGLPGVNHNKGLVYYGEHKAVLNRFRPEEVYIVAKDGKEFLEALKGVKKDGVLGLGKALSGENWKDTVVDYDIDYYKEEGKQALKSYKDSNERDNKGSKEIREVILSLKGVEYKGVKVTSVGYRGNGRYNPYGKTKREIESLYEVNCGLSKVDGSKLTKDDYKGVYDIIAQIIVKKLYEINSVFGTSLEVRCIKLYEGTKGVYKNSGYHEEFK